MEIGLGIHGEQGSGRVPVQDCDTVVESMIKRHFEQFLKAGAEVVVLINNLGACTDIEMSLVARAVWNELEEKRRVRIVRAVQGRLMTSLEMQGFSITLLLLSGDN
jgi:dihydroxyacetone kinase